MSRRQGLDLPAVLSHGMIVDYILKSTNDCEEASRRKKEKGPVIGRTDHQTRPHTHLPFDVRASYSFIRRCSGVWTMDGSWRADHDVKEAMTDDRCGDRSRGRS